MPPQISQRVGFSPQISRYFQYFMHNIATIYQHQLNKFESLTLVSIRAVSPENYQQIGSVQRKWQVFFFFSWGIQYSHNLSTSPQWARVPYLSFNESCLSWKLLSNWLSTKKMAGVCLFSWGKFWSRFSHKKTTLVHHISSTFSIRF